jgi:hypothetical protein
MDYAQNVAEDSNTEDSAEAFVDGDIKQGHAPIGQLFDFDAMRNNAELDELYHPNGPLRRNLRVERSATSKIRNAWGSGRNFSAKVGSLSSKPVESLFGTASTKLEQALDLEEKKSRLP